MTTWFVQTFESNQSLSHPDEGTWTTPSFFFVSSEQDDEETPWSAEIDKKLLCPKELIHKTKTLIFHGNENWDAGPQTRTEQSLFNPNLFCCELLVFGEGVWSMSDVGGTS